VLTGTWGRLVLGCLDCDGIDARTGRLHVCVYTGDFGTWGRDEWWGGLRGRAGEESVDKSCAVIRSYYYTNH